MMYQHSILWQSNFMARCGPRTKESPSTYRDATTKIQKGPTVISGDIKLCKHVLTSDCRGILVTTEGDIGQGRLDMEWHVPGHVWQSEEYMIKKMHA